MKALERDFGADWGQRTMPDSPNTKILVVDDLDEKLLVYRSILEEPGLDVIVARSGGEALQQLLTHEFAVVLLDVNMPGMDGFETAALIRGRKRCTHTPIIFITAYADELHALKGYSYGAVDYILAPVSPAVLRTKVGVFVQLFRLNRQLQEQTARRVALAESEGARLKAALDTATDFVARADLGGRVSEVNRAGCQMLGYTPEECVRKSLAELHIPGDRAQLQTGFSIALREGVWFGESTLRGGAGNEIAVSEVILAHKDLHGQIDCFSIVARDISQRKQAETDLRQSRERLRAVFNQAAVGIMLADCQGRFLEVNDRMCQITGRSADELRTLSFEMLTHPEDWSCSAGLIEDLVGGGRPEFTIEKRYRRGGAPEVWVWVSVTVSPLMDEQGRIHRLIGVVEDISARKLAEEEIRRHRERLEELVRERTSELEESMERLRLADRLASIGTLAAGLGHDMGNLLLPIRMRLEALEKMELPANARQDLQAIKTASEYLQRLSQGLRQFARDPEDTHGIGEGANPHRWWPDVEPFLRNALPRAVALESAIPADLPSIAIAPHRLTQIVFNLVQNAGDAMRERSDGLVRVTASLAPSRTPSGAGDHPAVVISVADNGPGMTDEVKRRCMEPFFTTKTRSISTGLGLALVRSAVMSVGGTIDIDARVGVGTTIRLILPTATTAADRDASRPRGRAPVAQVHLNDQRMSAYVGSILRSLLFDVRVGPWSSQTDAEVVVMDEPNGSAHDLEAFLRGSQDRRAVIFGAHSASPRTAAWRALPTQVAMLEAKPRPAIIRETLHHLVRAREFSSTDAPQPETTSP